MPTHDLRTLPTHQHLRAVGGLLLGALCCFQVSAQEFGSSLGYVPNGTGGGSYVKFGSGTKMTNMPNGNVSSFLDAAAGSKGLEIRGAAALPVGTAGRSVAVALTGKVTPAALGKVFGVAAGVLGGPGGIAILAGSIAIPALMDWMKQADLTPNSDGTFTHKSNTPGCESLVPQTPGWSTDVGRYWQIFSGVCVARNQANTVFEWVGEPVIPTGPGAVVALPFVVAALANFQPDPAILKELFTIDQTGRYSDQILKQLDITNVVASGPATVPGPSTTTDTPAQNGEPAKSTTQQTDYNCVYVMADVTCTDKKTTTEKVTTTDPATGAQTVKTTISTASAEAQPKTDTPDPCIAHPERNGCRSDTFDTPDGEVPKSSKTMTYQAENLGFAGGSCPVNKTKVLASGKTITVVDWDTNCQKITTYAKPMILAMAMFTALMIIFGGGGKVES
jgi:hypothetical protein